MEVLQSQIGTDISGPLLGCSDGYLNFSEVFFVSGGVHNDIFRQIVYSLVDFHVYEDGLYYHDTSGIDIHNPFKYLINCLAIRVGMC